MVRIPEKATVSRKTVSRKAMASKKQKVVKKPLVETHVMTLAETAKYLKVSKKTLEEQVILGNVPGRNIGGKWRFSKAALDLWLAQPSMKHQNAVAENKAVFLALAGAFAEDETFPAVVESIYAARRQLTLED
jgi:excisionase family DNA binding protein